MMMDAILDIIDSPFYNEILPNLYLGSVRTLYADPTFVDSLDVVVSIICPKQYTQEELRAQLPAKCEHMFIGIADSEESDMGEYFEPCYAFIEAHMSKGHKCFIHCVEGRSRSSTMVCYIYARENPGMSLENVIRNVKEARCIIRPNHAFIEQLIIAYNKIK